MGALTTQERLELEVMEAQEDYEIARKQRVQVAIRAHKSGVTIERIARALNMSYSGARQLMGLIHRSK